MQEKLVDQLGFTLTELLVTVTIVGVLAGLAAPSFIATIKNNRITTQVNQFIAALNLARSEAVKRGLRVTVCKSGNGTGCDTTAGNPWSEGWIVFTDENNNAAYNSATETLLKVQGAAPLAITITGDTPVQNYIAFASNGTSPNTDGISIAFSGTKYTSGTLQICDDRTGESGRSIALNATGRPKINTITCS